MLTPIQRRQFIRLFLLFIGAVAQLLVDFVKRVVDAREANLDENRSGDPAQGGKASVPAFSQSAQIEDYVRRIDRCDDL